jgi:hypothetical protein
MMREGERSLRIMGLHRFLTRDVDIVMGKTWEDIIRSEGGVRQRKRIFGGWVG